MPGSHSLKHFSPFGFGRVIFRRYSGQLALTMLLGTGSMNWPSIGRLVEECMITTAVEDKDLLIQTSPVR
jgi:hypothetical protein